MSADLVQAVGVALYGPRWQTELARDLDVSDRTVRRWVSGDDVPAGVTADLRRLCEARRQALADVIGRLG